MSLLVARRGILAGRSSGGGGGGGGNSHSLSFDGTNDHVELPTGILSSLTAFSVECWVKPTAASGEQLTLDMRGDINMFLLYDADDESARFWTFDGSTVHAIDSSTGSVPAGSWTHLAGTYDGATMRFYIDAATPLTLAASSVASSSQARNTIASVYDLRSSLRYDGLLDELRIWSDQRTDAEVTDNKDSELTGSEGGLEAYHKLNEGSGTTAGDETSNSHDGTIDGASWSTDTPF